MKNFWSSLQGKIVGWLIVLAIIMGIYAEAILAYKNTEDAKTATEIANNAAKLKLAEAEEKAQLAKKAAAEAETARATAEYAGKLKLAEAEERLQKSRTAKAEADVSPEMQAATLAVKQAESRKIGAEATVSEMKACAVDDSKCTPEQRCIVEGRSDVGSRYMELSSAAVAKLAPNSPLSMVSSYQKCFHLRNEVEAPAAAQPDEFQPSQLSPKCRAWWTKWQGFIHGAFATTTTDDCVMNGTQDFRGTKQGAIASLRKTCAQSGQSCEVIASK